MRNIGDQFRSHIELFDPADIPFETCNTGGKYFEASVARCDRTLETEIKTAMHATLHDLRDMLRFCSVGDEIYAWKHTKSRMKDVVHYAWGRMGWKFYGTAAAIAPQCHAQGP